MPMLLSNDAAVDGVVALGAAASALRLLNVASPAEVRSYATSNPCRARTAKSSNSCVDRMKERGRTVGERVSRFRTPSRESAGCQASVSARLTIVLLAMVSALAVRPVGARSTAVGQRSPVGPTTTPDCRPVQHDSLWQRLNLEATGSGPRLAAMPVDDANERGRRKRSVMDIESIDEDEVAPKRKKVNMMKLANEGKDVDEEQRRRKKRKGMRLVQQQTRQRRRTEKRKNPKKAAVKEQWQCRMESKWKKMDEGVFPPYVLTGRCKQTKCMMELYECTPRKYVVKVLKKVDAACFPVPAIGLNSTYEDAWAFADYKVTVGCDCVKRSSGTYYMPGSQS